MQTGNSMVEMISYQVTEGVALLFGFTLLAYLWGQTSKYQHVTLKHNEKDLTKFFIFFCIGLAWLSKFVSRLTWDYINISFVAYIDARSQWGKDHYQWYQKHTRVIHEFLQVLSIFKLCLLSLSFLMNLRKWMKTMQHSLQLPLTGKWLKLLHVFIIAEILMAALAIMLTMLLNEGPYLAGFYPSIEHYLVKPVLIGSYAAFYLSLKRCEKKRSNLPQLRRAANVFLKDTAKAYLYIAQFLMVATVRYFLQEYATPADFAGHARLYYLSFILLYYPSFLVMLLGMSKSVELALKYEQKLIVE